MLSVTVYLDWVSATDTTQLSYRYSIIIHKYIFKILPLSTTPRTSLKNKPSMASSSPTTPLSNDEEQNCSYAMQLATSTTLPMVLHTAIQLNILETISKAGPDAKISPSNIATQLGFVDKNPTSPAMIDRMLRLLASFSVVACSLGGDDGVTRVYGLGPVGKYFVKNEDGVSLSPFLALLRDKVVIDSWYQLKDSVMEGVIPFNRRHGTNAFEYLGKDLMFNEVFNNAMINHTTLVIKKLLECYKGFENLKRVVDVGGGLGVTLNLITSNYPTITGINFDLPHVIRHAPSYPGVEHVMGDMFESVPSGDAILMKWILHDWSDDHCMKLLKNCYKALPYNGKVIVIDDILPVIPDASTSVKSTTQMDLLMMNLCQGGKERTEQEFFALAKGAGFAGIRLECLVFNLWVMVFYK